MDMPVMPRAEELLEKGKTTASNSVKTTVSDVASSISDQVGLTNETNSSAQPQNTPQAEPQNQTLEENQRTKEMIHEFYSPSQDNPQINPALAQTDEQKLADVRQKLHQELHNDVYYQPLISYEQSVAEERPAEKAERVHMEELQQKEEKRQVDLPIAVKMAQTHTERNPGIAG